MPYNELLQEFKSQSENLVNITRELTAHEAKKERYENRIAGFTKKYGSQDSLDELINNYEELLKTLRERDSFKSQLTKIIERIDTVKATISTLKKQKENHQRNLKEIKKSRCLLAEVPNYKSLLNEKNTLLKQSNNRIAEHDRKIGQQTTRLRALVTQDDRSNFTKFVPWGPSRIVAKIIHFFGVKSFFQTARARYQADIENKLFTTESTNEEILQYRNTIQASQNDWAEEEKVRGALSKEINALENKFSEIQNKYRKIYKTIRNKIIKEENLKKDPYQNNILDQLEIIQQAKLTEIAKKLKRHSHEHNKTKEKLDAVTDQYEQTIIDIDEIQNQIKETLKTENTNIVNTNIPTNNVRKEIQNLKKDKRQFNKSTHKLPEIEAKVATITNEHEQAKNRLSKLADTIGETYTLYKSAFLILLTQIQKAIADSNCKETKLVLKDWSANQKAILQKIESSSENIIKRATIFENELEYATTDIFQMINDTRFSDNFTKELIAILKIDCLYDRSTKTISLKNLPELNNVARFHLANNEDVFYTDFINMLSQINSSLQSFNPTKKQSKIEKNHLKYLKKWRHEKMCETTQIQKENHDAHSTGSTVDKTENLKKMEIFRKSVISEIMLIINDGLKSTLKDNKAPKDNAPLSQTLRNLMKEAVCSATNFSAENINDIELQSLKEHLLTNTQAEESIQKPSDNKNENATTNSTAPYSDMSSDAESDNFSIATTITTTTVSTTESSRTSETKESENKTPSNYLKEHYLQVVGVLKSCVELELTQLPDEKTTESKAKENLLTKVSKWLEKQNNNIIGNLFENNSIKKGPGKEWRKKREDNSKQNAIKKLHENFDCLLRDEKFQNKKAPNYLLGDTFKEALRKEGLLSRSGNSCVPVPRAQVKKDAAAATNYVPKSPRG